ncbi:hypothetical protein [Barnesiella sp. An55]|uniref:hypothetical protein n=1 Tax=Barnesiella sp. An55 TaxID=1965646 RepID=UPI000B385CED|nr:hypothetical protein [Barnesiella sp. An55]OUN74362.1 hypothetical protein B5G10_02035 [Barnesiella sp. An55]HIZ27237.1 hypothetical protein [Candidatus Barnesiella merdipullorum]
MTIGLFLSFLLSYKDNESQVQRQRKTNFSTLVLPNRLVLLAKIRGGHTFISGGLSRGGVGWQPVVPHRGYGMLLCAGAGAEVERK